MVEQNLIVSSTLHQKFTYLLNEVINIENADRASLQLYDEKKEELHLILQKGFSDRFVEHFKLVKAFDGSACGRAIGSGNDIYICNVEIDHSFKPNLEVAKSEGFFAVKSVPLFENNKDLLGVVSTHYNKPKWVWHIHNINKLKEKLVYSLSELKHAREAS